MRTIGVVTVARSDYGIYLPLLRRVANDPDLRLRLFVGGMHLAPEFGRTVSVIEADGFEIAARVEMLLSSDTAEGVAKSVGLGVIGFAQALTRERSDLLVVLGDRFEMYAAALATVPLRIPLAHIHGGEVTEGAFDDALRHSMTKLSHLHFVATAEYGRRVRQLGEEAWRITVSGAPALDHLKNLRSLSRAELEKALGFGLEPNFLLATFHPVTLEPDKAGWQCAELLTAVETLGVQALFTLPNADTAGREVAQLIRDFVRRHGRARLVENLGTELYFNLMRHAGAMVGNSSSGLIEAPAFELPVVNIGRRQAGRVRGANVLDVEDGRANILAGLRRALSAEFRASLRDQPNPYSAGEDASAVIADVLKSVPLDDRLLMKRFNDLPATASV